MTDTDSPHGAIRMASLAIILAGLAAYWNSFSTPLVFDAHLSIIENPTIRSLSPLKSVLLPALPGSTVEGRPLVNLSFALNYAFGKLDPCGFHAVNLAVHLVAGLALFGIVRRTLLLPRFRDRTGLAATGLALTTATLWVVHPLQTESITNVVQRAESLMGSLFLLTLYCSIRAFTDTRPRGWQIAAVLMCLLGMAAKEVMAAAPLVILLYDRVFIAASWREVFSRRAVFHGALAMTWILLGLLVLSAGSHGGTVGLGLGVSPWDYATSQFGTILRYLGLTFWPHPLVIDYGYFQPVAGAEYIPAALVVAGLIAAGLAAFRSRPWIGFLTASFFLILAPTSSVVPIAAQSVSEHRMYLPLAPLLALIVVGGWLMWTSRAPTRAPAFAAVIVIGAMIATTNARNHDYRTEIALWENCVARRPANHRGQTNLGLMLAQEGRIDESIACYRKALDLNPGYALANANLGYALMEKGRLDEAIVHFEKGIAADPNVASAHSNFGLALVQTGRLDEAIAQCESAIALQPDYAKAHTNLGLALAKKGRLDEAIAHYEKSVELEPGNDKAHSNLAGALAQQGREKDAIPHYVRAIEIQPTNAKARNNLGTLLIHQGRIEEAIAQFRAAVEAQPDYTKAKQNLDQALRMRASAP